MSYCCVCCKKAYHPTSSVHINVDGNIYHYCHNHAYIGRKVEEQYIKILVKKNELP